MQLCMCVLPHTNTQRYARSVPNRLLCIMHHLISFTKVFHLSCHFSQYVCVCACALLVVGAGPGGRVRGRNA